jgi:hypothetical protein
VWAVLASPLLLSADLRTVKERHPECLELMLNREIIAVNQVSPNFPCEKMILPRQARDKHIVGLRIVQKTQQKVAPFTRRIVEVSRRC